MIGLSEIFGSQKNNSHTIHVWSIYLHLVDIYGKIQGKYTSPMDALWDCWENPLVFGASPPQQRQGDDGVATLEEWCEIFYPP